MRYEWKTNNKVFELHQVTEAGMATPIRPMMWDAYDPIGRLRKIKNKISCKKFALERFEYGSWTYITLLVMELDEAKEVARTVLIAGANDD
jgi:hypothetical protein